MIRCCVVSLLVSSVALAQSPRQVQRKIFNTSDHYVAFEFLDDDLLHFEMAAGSPPDFSHGIPTSPMVAKRDYAGPTTFHISGADDKLLESPSMRVEVDTNSGCWTVHDKAQHRVLTTVCPWNLHHDWKGITLQSHGTQNIYGLGQQFTSPGSADGDWMGKWRGGGPQGNALVGFGGGAVGNTQFPIMYALGRGHETYGLFMDDIYKTTWDFTADPWRVETWGAQLRGYIIAGKDMPAVRRSFMALTGKPLVPPKKLFGMWMSKYGYRSWKEVRDELASLRANKFPVDGFVLDLFWFGGVNDGNIGKMGDDSSHMGALDWDLNNFPEPALTMQSLRENDGVGIIPIEESYVTHKLPEFDRMSTGGHLVKLCKEGTPADMVHNGAVHDRTNPKEYWFWGRGGMLDWSNPNTRALWHQWKRQPLLDAGVTGMWTDLGEPEVFNLDGCYHGIDGFPQPAREADVHNIFSLLWHQGIYEGMQAAGSDKRPYIMSRSGAPGMQRYGAGMWSGDIGSNAASLATHYNTQMHMSLSGLDYYGADIGGFHRSALDGDMNELYTQWFADGAALDVPPRPHTMDIGNQYTTNPAFVGHRESNLANIRQRYELSPYLYSLAHQAQRTGEPVFPPLVYAFQDDATARQIGHEKMIGPSLLVGIVARYGESSRDVYLPRGTWVDVGSKSYIDSSGTWLRNQPIWRDGRFTLPMFARAGAIVPRMFVDDSTMNIQGQRLDGTRRDELIVQVFGDTHASSFTVFEDDGETTAYLKGEVRETPLSQVQDGKGVHVLVDAAKGDYKGAPSERATVVEVITRSSQQVQDVRLNGEVLSQHCDSTAWNAASSGWYWVAKNVAKVKVPRQDVKTAKHFDFGFVAPHGETRCK